MLRLGSPCILQPQPPHSVQGAVAAWRGLVEDLHASPRSSVHGSTIRNRTLLLCLLPTLFLGATYMLLVEFVLRESVRIAEVPPLLRFGGAGLVVLFLLVSLGCGLSLVDGALRPLRALQRIASGSEIPEGPAGYDLQTSDPDLRRLFLRIHMIAQQNRAGAQALVDLEGFQREAAEIRAELRRCAAKGRLPAAIGKNGNQHPIGLTREFDRFCSEMREGMETLEAGLAAIDDRMAAGGVSGPPGIRAQLDRLERAGTVWSLEVELARRRSPQMAGDLGACFKDFSAALADLREKTRSREGAVDGFDDVRSEVARLRRVVAQWLRGDSEAGGADRSSMPSRGETQ